MITSQRYECTSDSGMHLKRALLAGTTAMTITLSTFSAPTESTTDFVQARGPRSTVDRQAKSEAAKSQVLLKEWLESTAFQSSPKKILGSSPYLEAKVLRSDKLIKDLMAIIDLHPYHASLALADIKRDVPFGPDIAGDIAAITAAWKTWWVRHDVEQQSVSVFSESA